MKEGGRQRDGGGWETEREGGREREGEGGRQRGKEEKTET